MKSFSGILVFLLLSFFGYAQTGIFRLNSEQDRDIESRLYKREANAHPNIKPFVLEWMPIGWGDSIFKNDQENKKWRPWVQNRHWISVKSKKSKIELSPLRSAVAGFQTGQNKEVWMWGGGFLGNFFLGNKFSAQLRWEYFNEHPLGFIDSLARKENVVQGIGTPHKFSNRLEYTYPNAVFSWAPNSFLHLSLGHGKFFLGDGYRSLLLSDAAPNYPYAALQGKLWKFRYLSVASRWTDTRVNPANPTYRQYKFSSIHYLSWNIIPRLNFSLFESIVYQNRNNNSAWGIEPNYLNPIIFFRPVEYAVGSTDNALLGASFRWEIFRQWFLYGQIMLDEFYFSQIRKFNGWQDNKQAFQGGIKAYDLAGIKGLYVQAEINCIRPYTYFHKNTLQNYSHNLQSMAHPLGANLIEGIFQTSYQRNRWFFSLRANGIRVGLDGYSQIFYGQNIFGNYFNRPQEFNNSITQGVKTNIMNVGLRIAYSANRLTGTSVECDIGSRSLSNIYTNQKSNWFMLGLKTNLDNFYRDY
jgi:hypothetical protein